jgi:hypothetical protein
LDNAFEGFCFFRSDNFKNIKKNIKKNIDLGVGNCIITHVFSVAHKQNSNRKTKKFKVL